MTHADFKTYICIVCGFVYDEAAGRPEDDGRMSEIGGHPDSEAQRLRVAEWISAARLRSAIEGLRLLAPHRRAEPRRDDGDQAAREGPAAGTASRRGTWLAPWVEGR